MSAVISFYLYDVKWELLLLEWQLPNDAVKKEKLKLFPLNIYILLSPWGKAVGLNHTPFFRQIKRHAQTLKSNLNI